VGYSSSLLNVINITIILWWGCSSIQNISDAPAPLTEQRDRLVGFSIRSGTLWMQDIFRLRHPLPSLSTFLPTLHKASSILCSFLPILFLCHAPIHLASRERGGMCLRLPPIHLARWQEGKACEATPMSRCTLGRCTRCPPDPSLLATADPHHVGRCRRQRRF
jgi:hypothetical protein